MHKNATFLILFGTLLVAGGFVLYERQKLDSVTVPPVSVDNQPGEDDKPIAIILDGVDENGWKTLRSELFGFEMKFPGEWIGDWPSISRRSLLEKPEGSLLLNFGFGDPKNIKEYSQSIDIISENVDVYFQKVQSSIKKANMENRYSHQEKNINNAKAYIFIDKEKAEVNRVLLGGGMYTFEINDTRELDGRGVVYDKIISTFHLLP